MTALMDEAAINAAIAEIETDLGLYAGEFDELCRRCWDLYLIEVTP